VRRQQSISCSINYSPFIELSLLSPHEPATGPYPEPVNSVHIITQYILWYILILSSHLLLGLPSGLFPTGEAGCYCIWDNKSVTEWNRPVTGKKPSMTMSIEILFRPGLLNLCTCSGTTTYSFTSQLHFRWRCTTGIYHSHYRILVDGLIQS
jgi:hypothetical protein